MTLPASSPFLSLSGCSASYGAVASVHAQVLPKLAVNGCPVCHMPGAGCVRPETGYDGLFPFLAIGQAADTSLVSNMKAGWVTHETFVQIDLFYSVRV